jgi:hypothetical protein
VTRRDSRNFAVEVALLVQFVLEGAADESDGLLGGHVFFIPTCYADLQGRAEKTLVGGVHLDMICFKCHQLFCFLLNFCSLRFYRMGRYPFLPFNRIDGTVVSKAPSGLEPALRRSPWHAQSAISDNVAFDTMGHCYMTKTVERSTMYS